MSLSKVDNREGYILVDSKLADKPIKIRRKELQEVFICLMNKKGEPRNKDIRAITTIFEGQNVIEHLSITSFPNTLMSSKNTKLRDYYLSIKSVKSKTTIILNREETERCYRELFSKDISESIRRKAEKTMISIKVEVSGETIDFINNKSKVKVSVKREDVEKLIISHIRNKNSRGNRLPRFKIQFRRTPGNDYRPCMKCGRNDFPGTPLPLFYSSPFILCEDCCHKFVQEELGIDTVTMMSKVI